MGSVPLNSCEPARPADTNAAPVVRLRAYLFATSFVIRFRFQNILEGSNVGSGSRIFLRRKNELQIPYAAAFERSFQQRSRSETLVFSGDLSGKLSSPAVQQLWTLYPGKQTANLF
ncbi:hypothetical protein Tco_0926825 [Tanacetum coccineum]|uniref:Uncharacterized protein n=1 Tax=Tanacetum coccineum TaxID=301880 RepID=A0ABQ5DDU5_9ASTR